MCIPGYVGDADIACNLRKIVSDAVTNISGFSGKFLITLKSNGIPWF